MSGATASNSSGWKSLRCTRRAEPAHMKEELDQIRELLDRLETKSTVSTLAATPFSGLELPDILRDVVDILFPLINPYDATFYLYMLRNSIIENGSPYVRVGGRTLSTAIRSSRERTTSGGGGPVTKISDAQIKTTLGNLQKLGAIRKENEPDRNGTLYRVLLPEEIEACQQYRHKIHQAECAPIAVDLSADFYNVRENRIKVYERDDYKCTFCHKQLTRFTATLDHVTPVGEGGNNSFDNLVTACLDCNSRKNKRPLGDFLAEHPANN
jgi:hypothetical protein